MTSSTTFDLAACGLTLALLFAPAAALGQAKSGDPVAAQALFKAARELVDKGDWDAGCPKFEASLALQASASTMLNIARCHEHFGKIASAWDDYNRALTLNLETKGADRKKGLEELAKKGIADLEPRLPRLRIVVKGAPAGLAVTRDGTEIPAAALGDALPADAGAHEIRASAPGFKSETKKVSLEEGKTATVEFTLIADKASGKDETPPGKDEAKPGVPVWAWIAGAGGLALAGASVYFLVDDLAAVDALQKPSNCRPLSGGGYFCDPRYDYAADNARKNLDLPLFAGLGAAGVLAIGASVFGIVRGVSAKPAAPASAMPAAWIAPGGAGASISGAF